MSTSISYELCDEEQEDHDEYIASLEEYENRKRLSICNRPNKFINYVENHKNDPKSIFNLRGINFIRYTHKKIKFTFQPSLIADMISRRTIFIISLKFRMGYWMIKKDHVPVNYKWRIYKLFYTKIACRSHFRFTDENIPIGIQQIWEILCHWAIEDDLFRRDKQSRYRKGEDVYIDEDDEELFLTEAEAEEQRRKKSRIWKRMLPPPEKNSERPKRKRRKV